jgi:hypothetical protein
MEIVVIRRNGVSRYIRVPQEFLRQHDLKPGDVLGWKSGKEGAEVRVIARVPEQESVPEPEPEAA